MANKWEYQGRKKGSVWTFEQAKSMMEHGVFLSKSQEFIYIGEIAFEINQGHLAFHGAYRKFPELKEYMTEMRKNCEVNALKQVKDGAIPPAVGIFILKVQHKWNDHATESEGQKITIEGVSNEEIEELLNNSDENNQ